jgi:hypothetical protein
MAPAMAFSTPTAAAPVSVPSPPAEGTAPEAAPAVTPSDDEPSPDRDPSDKRDNRAERDKRGKRDDRSSRDADRDAKPPKVKVKRGALDEPAAAPVDVEAQLARSAQLIKQGYTRHGVQIAHDLLRQDPRNGRAFRLLGIGYTLMNNTRMACESYRRYLMVTPGASDRAKVEELLASCPGG